MNELERLAREAATKHGLDPALVCALCEVESSWIPWAVRHEPGYRWLWGLTYDDYPIEPRWLAKEVQLRGYTAGTERIFQRTSWGLMQIMGAVARERGFRGWLTELCDPTVNLQWGCRHLRWMLDHPDSYGIPRPGKHGIILVGQEVVNGALAAAWNAGSVRYDEGGKLINVDYVRRAVKAMEGYQ